MATPINVVVDISHYNTVSSFKTVKDDGIVGIVHKVTQGTDLLDSKYQMRKPAALEAGLWWGAYHFGVSGDGAAQAQYFLSHVKPGPTDLLVLDLEQNPTGASMSLTEAEDFVKYVEAETGRWPGVYGGSYITEILGRTQETALSFCWLWVAEYASRPHLPPAWKVWTMWQYTDGKDGPEPHAVAGIGNCDRDMFNGDMDGLRELWGYQIAAADTAPSAAAETTTGTTTEAANPETDQST